MPERVGVDAVLLGQRLQLAVAVAHTAVALAVVFAEQQLQHMPARHAHLACVCPDPHLIDDRERAGRLQRALALDLHDAHAADAGHVEVGVIAQGRDGDAAALGGLEDGGAERHLRLDAVDGHAHLGADGVRAGGGDDAPMLLRERRAMDRGGGIAHAHSSAIVRRSRRGCGSRRRSPRGSRGRRLGWSARGRTSRRPASCRPAP